jgi:hypothetical protein
VVLGCTAAPAVPPARDLDFFISNRVPAPAGPLASASEAPFAKIRNRSTVREKNGGLTQLLALEQSGGRTGALLSKNIDRTAKSLCAFFSDYGRSLEWYTVQRQVPSIKFT